MERRDFLQYSGLMAGALALPVRGRGPDLLGALTPIPSADKKDLADAALNAARSAGATYADVRIARSLSEFVSARERRAVAHMRELVLVWPDKQELIIRLDHGLGFFRMAPPVRHDFRSAPERQARAIQAATLQIEKFALGSVPLYVSGVLQR